MLIKRKDNIFGDNSIAYLESYDFSKANMSNASRLDVITLVASICYQNPKAHGSESLYNRLMAESGGLPSSSFEFVPVLLHWTEVKTIKDDVDMDNNPLTKYGEWIENGNYLLTNFRAIVYFNEEFGIDLRDRFNTEAECAIIAKHFKVFKMKVDMPTFGQAVRHRVNWQVMSRRYVSGTKVPFDFYVADKMKKVNEYYDFYDSDMNSISLPMGTEDIINLCMNHYKAALKAGVKPEVARGIIPQCAYATAWCAMQPKQFNSFVTLRSDLHAQWEIQQLSNSMKELTNG